MAIVAWKLPELGENVEKATVLRLLVQVGAQVHRDQPVLEVETDKVTVEVPCTVSGRVTAVCVKAGDQIGPGQVVMEMDTAVAAPTAAPTARDAVKTPSPPVVATPQVPTPMSHTAFPSAQPAGTRTAPLARKLARELGLSLEKIPGTGPDGIVLLDDVKTHAKALLARTMGAPQGTSLPDFRKWGTVRREPWSQIRGLTVQRMTTAWTTIPHVTHFDEANITKVEAQRTRWNAKLKKGAAKLTMTAILLHAIARALQQHPHCNASLDLVTQEVIYKDFINIGVAVDTEQGLLVPVVKAVDRKDLAALAHEVHALAEKARTRRLTLDDVQGAGFTISNLGGIGGTNFTPIINPPEVAILGVARGRKVGARLFLPLGLSYDHRLIDGAAAARFVRFLADTLEALRLA